ncbi:MAG: sugar phosphate isomerase/epimerase [Verrucomicrobiota bacterium]
MNRRHFLQTSALSASALVLNQVRAAVPGLKIGMDHFSVRATGWKAAQHIEYAASLKLDTCFISELGVFENFEDAYLQGLKDQADKAGIKLYVGTGGVCPTSNTWKPTFGTPEETLALTINAAKKLGSPVARCYLGNQKDRSTDGGIQKHIEETIKVIKANQSRAEGEGIKIAIENHAGDMQSHELKALIEAAGKGYVGANIDPGNAVWAMEEPMAHLEVLGPYTLCSSVRDSMAWEDEKGAVIQWTAIGEGLVDFSKYAKRFAELAPGVPLQVETISGFAKPMTWKQEEFWKPFPGYQGTAAFKTWVEFTQKGKPLPSFKAPDGADKKAAEIAYQKGELERSTQWLREKA